MCNLYTIIYIRKNFISCTLSNNDCKFFIQKKLDCRPCNVYGVVGHQDSGQVAAGGVAGCAAEVEFNFGSCVSAAV